MNIHGVRHVEVAARIEGRDCDTDSESLEGPGADDDEEVDGVLISRSVGINYGLSETADALEDYLQSPPLMAVKDPLRYWDALLDKPGTKVTSGSALSH